MNGQRFKKMCYDCFPALFPRTQSGSTSADLIFAELLRERREKNPTENKVDFDTFYTIGFVQMVKIAKEQGKDDIDMGFLQSQLMASSGPVPNGTTVAGVVRQHDDKSTYTGAQAQVFGVKKERSIESAGW